VSASPRDRLRSISTNPVNLLCLGLALVWLAMALFARPIGDYGVETDFYGDAVYAEAWRAGHATVMNGYRGPGYHLILGVLGWVTGDLFLAGKLLSVLAAALGLRLLAGLLGSLWGRAVALCGVLFVAAVPVFLHYTFRACTDPLFWFLFVAVLVLLFREEGPTVRNWAEAGAVAGLAWLVRYNGAVLVPVALVVALLVIRPWRQALGATAAFLGTGLLVAAPWMAFLWRETGNPLWNRTYELVAANVYGGNPSLAEAGRLKTYVGFASLREVVAVDPGQVARSLLASIAGHLRGDVTELVGIPLAAVAALGLSLSWKIWRGRRPIAFLIAGGLTFGSLVPVFYNPRFMLPLLVWWGAAGAGVGAFAYRKEFEGKRRWWRAGYTGVVAGLLVAVVVSNGKVITRALDPASNDAPPWELLELGKRVKELDLPLGSDTPIAARKPQIGYVLGTPVVAIPFGSLDDLRRTGARYLLVSRAEISAYPNLRAFVEHPTTPPPGLRYVASYRGEVGGVGQFAALYEVEGTETADETEDGNAEGTYAPPAPEGLSRVDELRVRLARWYLIWDPTRPIGNLLERIDPANRTHLDVLLLSGDEAWVNGQFAEAYRIYKEARSEHPEEDRVRYRLAGLRLLEGDTLRPRLLLSDSGIPAGADTALWWEARGAALLESGEYTAAVAPFLVSLDFAPKRARVYRSLGDALLQGGRLEDALASYDTCLRFSAARDPALEERVKELQEAIRGTKESGP